MYPNSYAFQYWDSEENSTEYTALFIDIVDDFNQFFVSFPSRGTGMVDDNVSGYTLAFVESEMLKYIYELSSLSSELKAHKPNGITDDQIDLLISHY